MTETKRGRARAGANAAKGSRRAVLLGVVALLAFSASSAQASPLTWSQPQVIDPPLFSGDSDIVGVSCPSDGLCMAIDSHGDEGHLLHSTDPATVGATWATADLPKPAHPKAVSCPSAVFCAVADSRGNIWTTSEPTEGISAWTLTPLDTETVEHETSFGLLDVSCPSASFCAVIDDLGTVFTSTEPTDGASAWTETVLSDTDFEAIACQSPSLCVITDFDGNVLTSAEPMAGGTTWNSAHVDANGLGGVSCPSVSLCVIGGFFGSVFTANDPNGGTGAWTPQPEVDGLNYLLSLSCPSVSFCAAVDSFGDHVLTSLDPQHEWNLQPLAAPEALLSISCPSAAFCLIGGSNGSVVIGTPESEEPSEKGGGQPEGWSQGNPPAGGNPSPTPMLSPVASPKPHKKPLKCRKGFKKRRVHGKARCVKAERHHRGAAGSSVEATPVAEAG